jgi:hypothetical protein
MYKVARVVIGENKTFVGGEKYLEKRGVEVVVFDNEECKALMSRFIEEQPAVWYASIHQQFQTIQRLTSELHSQERGYWYMILPAHNLSKLD